jgi:hypothetical protein
MMKAEVAPLIAAVESLAEADFSMGPEWQALHDLCQAHEGEPPFDWGHALCHRIEGDDWNAGYWYRRAGRPVAIGSYADEWAAMKAEIST